MHKSVLRAKTISLGRVKPKSSPLIILLALLIGCSREIIQSEIPNGSSSRTLISGCPSDRSMVVKMRDMDRTETIRFHSGSARLECDITVEVDGTSSRKVGIAGVDFPIDVPRQPLASAFDEVLAGRTERQDFTMSGMLRGITFINKGYVRSIERGDVTFNGERRPFTRVVLHGKEAFSPATEIVFSFVTLQDGSFLPVSIDSATPSRVLSYRDTSDAW